MPNHIQNKLVVTGKENDIKIFLGKIKNDDENECIDFNKITPMPSILKDTIEGSKTSNAIYYYLYTDNKQEYIPKMLSSYHIYSIDRFKNNTKEELKEYFEIGKKYFETYKEYGSVTWYDWSIKNWGTKWNAYETYADDIVSLNDDTHEVTMYFQTAWKGVPMLIEKLIYMFPNLYFDYKYADEDVACNCGEGVMVMKNKVFILICLKTIVTKHLNVILNVGKMKKKTLYFITDIGHIKITLNKNNP